MAQIFNAYWLGYQEPTGQTLDQTPEYIDHVTLFLAGPTAESKVTTAYLCKVYGEEQIVEWVGKVRARGQKVLLSFLDNETHWNEVDMPTFAASAREVMDKWGLDGFDIDAESSMPEGVFAPSFIELAEALSGILDGKLLTYTCYQGCGPDSNDNAILSKIRGQLSWVQLMAYWNDAGGYEDLYRQYANVVADDMVAIGVMPGKEGTGDQSTRLEDVKKLSAWNPPGSSKAGMMMFGTNRDNPQFTAEPDWTYAQAIREELG
jgi:hypothetical protein